jgi:uncharacterized membrane protein YfcA
MLQLLFWITAFFASVLGTMAGFGISSILLPVAVFVFDYKIGLALTSMFYLFNNVGRIAFYRHNINRHLVFTFGVPSICLTLIGSFLKRSVNQNMLKPILGISLLLYGYLSYTKTELRMIQRSRNTLLGGSIYGFLSGLVGIGGSIRGAMLAAFNIETEAYVSTNGVISLGVDLTRVPIYLLNGYLPSGYIYYIPVLLLVALAGGYISRNIVDRISTVRFRSIILIRISIISIKLLFDGLRAILFTA